MTRTRINLPAALRRADGMASIEIPEDPAAVAVLEAFFGSVSSEIERLKTALGSAEATATEMGAANAALEAKVAELAPMAELGATLDRAVSTEKAKALGVDAEGDSGPAIREEVVLALRPEALSRYKAGTPERRIAADAAFDVLFGACLQAPATPAAPAPEGPTRRLSTDSAPAGSQTLSPAARRFNVEA